MIMSNILVSVKVNVFNLNAKMKKDMKIFWATGIVVLIVGLLLSFFIFKIHLSFSLLFWIVLSSIFGGILSWIFNKMKLFK